MKKNVLFILPLCLFTTIIASSQINKGAVFLGGNLNALLQNSKSEGNTIIKQNGISVTPVFGKAVKQNLVVGGDATVSFAKYTNPNSFPEVQKQTAYGVGVFARKYKPLGNSDFYVFAQGRFGLDYTKSRYAYDLQTNNTKRYAANVIVYPGIAYAVSRRFQLETGLSNLLTLGYYNETTNISGGIPDKVVTNSFSISSSLSNGNSWLYIGFRVLLNKV